MAYSELVKTSTESVIICVDVYGFKSRDEYNSKSARSYDDERRRLESWLGDYMQFRKSAEGKNVFISIDSRMSRHNPLYRAWKTKSFTDGDITLHFILFDILYDEKVCLSLGEITEKIDEYLAHFKKPRMFDESTVRKKLKEYVGEGIIIAGKRGKSVYYRRASQGHILGKDVLDYYSETAPCGVIGSFLDDYLHDVELCQQFARRNKERIAEVILERTGMAAEEAFHTIHNYIDTEEMILRKGAIAAHEGEKVLIPINMRDGSVIAIGKSNHDWNYSAPHGAGRIMSRAKAKQILDMNEYRAAMQGIYTTSVNENTIDEAPMAYKSLEDIIDVIKESVDVVEVMKPVYNFKASGNDEPWMKKKQTGEDKKDIDEL